MEYLGKLHETVVKFPQTDIWMDSCGAEELDLECRGNSEHKQSGDYRRSDKERIAGVRKTNLQTD